MLRLCLLLLLAITVKADNVLKVQANRAGLEINVGWWLQESETIISCKLHVPADGPVSGSCAGNSQHVAGIPSQPAGTVGNLEVNVNNLNSGFWVDIQYVAVTLANGFCFHGTISGSTCNCDFGWGGPSCNTLTNVISLPTSGGTMVPLQWLTASETITGCAITGLSAGVSSAACAPTGSPAHQISVAPHPTATGSIAITVSDGNVYWSVQYADSTLTTACVNGRPTGSANCQCQTGWSGSDCNTPVCNQGCQHGTCTAPDVCTCQANYHGAACDTHDCNCKGVGAGCTCNFPLDHSQSYAIYTKCDGTGPAGWSKTAACSWKCHPIPEDIFYKGCY